MTNSRVTVKILGSLACLYIMLMLGVMISMAQCGCAHTREVKASTGHDHLIPVKSK